ncbi:LysR family transcriptional regulator [Acuticoccus sediminis]|nr:LysR family transcriptional regulator [Acuticoccus sediminis]
MAVFVRVVERQSFARAAEDLGLSRATVTEAVKGLEHRLGVRCLDRTTRVVRPTPEGEAYYRRCIAILGDVEEAETEIASRDLEGFIRFHAHGDMLRAAILPRLPEFLRRHPGIRLHIGEGDRMVDLVREGIDCVVRAGDLTASSLVGRRVGVLAEGTFASPGYLAGRRTPAHPDDLDGFEMVSFVSSLTGAPMPLEFVKGEERREMLLPQRVSVDGAATLVEAVRLGWGIGQMPRYRLVPLLRSGALVEILADWAPTPTPVTVLYPEGRRRAPRVAAFVDFLIAILTEALAGDGPVPPGAGRSAAPEGPGR